MREAVGSTFLFQIMIILIFFFVSFLAIAINYSQAFQTKNKIINALEQGEGYNENSRETIENVQAATGYYREVNCNRAGEYYFVAQSASSPAVDLKGICIKHNTSNDMVGGYYSVTTYINFTFPIIGNLIAIPVSGETKLIVNDNFD